MEYDLVAQWLRRDRARWIAGAISGLFAAAVAILAGMTLSALTGQSDITLTPKIFGTLIVGSSATEYTSGVGLWAGTLVLEILGMISGMIYSHFVPSQSLYALLPMGAAWGIFSWIFLWNLTLQSFTTISALGVPSSEAFAVCLSFGLSLSLIKLFDPLARKLTGSVAAQ